MVRLSGPLHDTTVRALTLLRAPDWKLVSDTDGYFFHEKPVEWCNKKAVYIKTNTSASFDDVKNFISQPEALAMKDRNLFKMDELLDLYEVIKDIDEDTQIVYTAYKSPFFGVSARDVVTLSHECILSPEEAEANGFHKEDRVFVQSSYSQSDAVPSKKGYVRGESHCYAIFLVQPAGVTDRCELSLVLSFDPSGMIPAKVVDLSAQNQKKKLIHLRSHVEKR